MVMTDLESTQQDHCFLIAVLTAADLVIYVYCAKWYKCINVEESKDGASEGWTSSSRRTSVQQSLILLKPVFFRIQSNHIMYFLFTVGSMQIYCLKYSGLYINCYWRHILLSQ